MTNEQRLLLRQHMANLIAAVASISPTYKSANFAIDASSQQVNINIQEVDSSIPSGTAVAAQILACKYVDLPPAQ